MHHPSSIGSPFMPRLRIFSVIGAAILYGALVGLSGCGTSGPEISGFALANTRYVKTGDIVSLRSPLTPDGKRQWRVISYDPDHLSMLENPRYVLNDDGIREMVTEARAKATGLTIVIFSEIHPPEGRKARRSRFRIRITD